MAVDASWIGSHASNWGGNAARRALQSGRGRQAWQSRRLSRPLIRAEGGFAQAVAAIERNWGYPHKNGEYSPPKARYEK
jgi:hypothetical protein